jgi:Ca2+-binding RTX toxin-like protein
VRNGALLVEALDGSGRDILDGVEQIAFNDHLYDVQRLVELLQTQTVVDDECEVTERRERERDTASQAAAIALASVYGIAATAHTEESSAEEMTWFGANPNASANPNGEGSGQDGVNAPPWTVLVNPAGSLAQPVVAAVVEHGATAANDGGSGTVLPADTTSENGGISGEYAAPVAPAASPAGVVAAPSGSGDTLESGAAEEGAAAGGQDDRNTLLQDGSGGQCDSGGDQPPPAMSPGIDAVTVTTLEDESVLLSIGVFAPNASTTLSIAVTGIPEGGRLSAGEEYAPGEWRLAPDELEGLRFFPPENSDVDVVLSIKAVSSDRYGRAGSSIHEQQVEIVAVADAPGIGVADSASDEDAVIPLNLSADYSDLDGSELHRIELLGIPAGAVLSAGTMDAGGVWHLAPQQLEGLTLTPPLNDANDFTVTVRGIAEESENGNTAVTEATFAVTVNAVADAPGIGVADSVGDEDAAIALNLAAYYPDLDGSEVHRIELIGIPAGAVLSAGTLDADGVWHLTPQQLEGLTLTPPLNNDNDFTVTVRGIAEESENGNTAVTEATFAVTVNAVADAPELVVVDMVADEDHATPLELFPQLVDTDGSETLSLLIEGVPVGAVLSQGTELAPGVWQLTPDEAAMVVLTPAGNSDEDFQLRVTATTTEDENGDQAHTVRMLNVTLNAVSDGAAVTATPAEGDQNQFIDLDISAELFDTDGSETLAVEIRDVPAGATLSAGTDLGNGAWRLSPEQLAGLQILPPLDSTGNFYLTVAAISTEGENGDSLESYASLNVVVNAVANTAGLTIAPAFGDEDTAIPLDIRVDTSNLNANESVHIAIRGLPAGATLSAGIESGGVWTLAPAELAGLALIPAQDSDEDFTLDVTAVTKIDGDSGTGRSVSASAPVTVNAVADGVELAAADVSGQEDSLIALDIAGQLRDLDGSEVCDVTISGLPADAVLSAGTSIALGVWQLSGDQLEGLMLKPPADADGSYTLAVTATSREKANGDNAQPVTTSFDVMVDPVADVPGLVAAAGAAVEGEPVALDIGAWLNDVDGSENLLLEIEGLPGNSTLSAGSENKGVWQLTPTELDGLMLNTNKSWNQDFTLTVRAISTESNGDSGISERLLEIAYGQTGAPTLAIAVASVESATAGNDTLNGLANEDSLAGGGGEDIVKGMGGNDLLYGDTSGAMAMVALNIDAALQTSDGSETLTVVIEGVPDGASFNAGNQAVDAGGNPIPGSWVLLEGDLPGLVLSTPADGNDFTLQISAVAVNLSTQGTLLASGQVSIALPDIDGGDYLEGGAGDDRLYGEGGDDLLKGGAGSDLLDGGDGDDTLVIDADDWNGDIDGGAGIDTVIIDDDRDVTFSTAVSAVENVYGGRGNDVIVGDDEDNVLFGGAGADTLDGGGGDDEIHADAADVAAASDFVNGGSGTDTLIFEGSVAVNFDVDGRGFEYIHGSAGDDTLRYGGGVGVLAIDGGTGVDTIDYGNAASGVTVDLATGNATGAALSGIENIIGTAFDDALVGNGENNVLRGGAGDDVLDGGAGRDTAVYTGRFYDYYDGHGTTNITHNGDVSATVSGAEGNDTLSGIEQLYFEADDRTVYLDGSNNRPDAVDDLLAATEDVTARYTAADLLANDFDFDGDTFTLVDVNAASAMNGTVTWNADGTISFTPRANCNSSENEWDSGSALYRDQAGFGFEYTIEDANGERHTAWAAIEVQAVNDAPKIVSSGFTHDGTVSGSGHLVVEDIDSNPGSFEYSQSSLALNGTHTSLGQRFMPDAALTVQTSPGSIYLEIQTTLSTTGSLVGAKQVTNRLISNDSAPNTANYDYTYTGYQSPIGNHYLVWEKMGDFSITVSDGDGGSATLNSAGTDYEKVWWEPLVLDLDGDGIELVGIDAGVTYDLDGDGVREATGWVGPDDALLVHDFGHDGDVSDVDELMFLSYAIDAENELDVLRLHFDTNRDGRFDAADEAWNDFALWQDANLNGVADEGELTYMPDSGVDSIELDGQATAVELEGNRVVEVTEYIDADGQSRELGVVFFETVMRGWQDALTDTAVADLALLQSYGDGVEEAAPELAQAFGGGSGELQQQAEILVSMLAVEALETAAIESAQAEAVVGIDGADEQWDELNFG